VSEARDVTRDNARTLSRDCEYCGGHGMARVYYPEYRGDPTEEVACWGRGGEVVRKAIPVAVMAHCVCPLGRWMRGRLDGDTLAGIPDLMEILTGRSRWLARDPTGGEHATIHQYVEF
jgi:hypothetical protein